MLAIVTALVSLTSGSGPVKFDLTFDRPSSAAGQPIYACLSARNTSNAPVVLAKAIWDGAPAANASITLLRFGKVVETFGDSSMPLLQVMVSSQVDKERFVILKPNQSVTLCWKKFEGERVFRGKGRGKQSYAESREIPLAPGSYECVAKYEFDAKKISDGWKRDWLQDITFEPGARSLWNEAQKAAVRISQPLRIEKASSPAGRA